MLGILPVAMLVFLVSSDFFTAWDGQVISTAPPHSDDPKVLTVRIVGADREVIQRTWPTELVRSLEVPVDRVAVPPPELPDDRPRTTKSRFSLSFDLVIPDDDGERTVSMPTTSPRGLGVAVLVFLGLVAVRNMLYAGSPIALQRREVYLPPAQGPAGVPNEGPARRKGKRRGRKGPPPPKRRRGRGRR